MLKQVSLPNEFSIREKYLFITFTLLGKYILRMICHTCNCMKVHTFDQLSCLTFSVVEKMYGSFLRRLEKQARSGAVLAIRAEKLEINTLSFTSIIVSKTSCKLDAP